MTRCLFMSHTWASDEEGRDNHKRIVRIAAQLERLGWKVWIDEKHMHGDIDVCMANGIDNCDAVIFCLSRSYFHRVNETRFLTNCKKEWNYTHFRNKYSLPVVMERSLLNSTDWPTGIISMRMSNTLYVDASSDNFNAIAKNITNQLKIMNIRPITYRRRRGITTMRQQQKNVRTLIRI